MNDLQSPATIPFQPLPQTGIGLPTAVQTTGGKLAEMTTPTVVKPTVLPSKVIAMETISSNLDTKTKRILGKFDFGLMGAIVIGEYVHGESGEIRISPEGVIMKNVNGDETIVFDPLPGDAFFKGTIQAGSLIAGGVDVGDDSVQIDGVNGRIVCFTAGIPDIIIGNV